MKRSLFPVPKMRNSASLSGFNNSKVNSSAQFPIDEQSDSVPGYIITNALIQKASREIEVTHEVFFGENIRRVIRYFFGK
jgi:hypothetical protein